MVIFNSYVKLPEGMCFLLEQDPGVQHYGGEMFQVLRRPEMGWNLEVKSFREIHDDWGIHREC